MLSRGNHWTLSIAKLIEPTSSCPIYLSCTLILSFRQCHCLPNEYFSHVFRLEFCLISYLSPSWYMSRPACLPWFGHPSNISGEEQAYRFWGSFLCSFREPPVTSSLLGRNVLIITFLRHSNYFSLFRLEDQVPHPCKIAGNIITQFLYTITYFEF
jgi:hypothetical protein